MITLAAACESGPRPGADLPEELAVPAFRAMLDQADTTALFCLEYGGVPGRATSNAPLGVVGALERSGIAVRPMSRCALTSPSATSDIRDTGTGRRGYIVTLGDSLMGTADTLEVSAHMTCGLTCGTAGVVRLWRTATGWAAAYRVRTVS